MKIVITGGGSGGHVSPALAVADYLRRHHPDISLLYIGGRLAMEGEHGPSVEQRLVEPTGIPFVAIKAGKLPRDRMASWQTIKRLWGVLPGCFQAWRQLRRFRPNVIFSTGGYVAVPVVLAAAFLRLPVIVHEQTAVVGLANRISAKFARQVALSFPSSARYFPADKVVITGNPLNPAVLDPQPGQVKAPLADWINRQTLPLVYVTGGGLGSHVINVAVEEALSQLLGRVSLVHQIGSHPSYQDAKRLAEAQQQLPAELSQRYWPVERLTPAEVGFVYSRSQLVVARAGANTVMELAATGLSAILIPIPWVTHNEQQRNAELLVDAGTGRILPEAELSGPNLQQAILNALGQLPDQAARDRARQLVQADATPKLAALVLKAAQA